MNPTFIFGILFFLSLAFNALQASWNISNNSEHKAKIAQMERDDAYAQSASEREARRELTRLVAVNKEIQDEINRISSDMAALDADNQRIAAELAVAERVRNNLSKQFPAAVERAAAGALRAYAQEAERDIGFAEGGLEQARRDTEKYGREAVSAATASDAYRDTLRARRQALADRAKAIQQVITPTKTPTN